MRAVIAIDPGDRCGVALVIDGKLLAYEAVDFTQNKLDLVTRSATLQRFVSIAESHIGTLTEKIMLVCEQPYLPAGLPGAVMNTAKVYANATLWEAVAHESKAMSSKIEILPRVNASAWQSKFGIKGKREKRFALADECCKTLFKLHLAKDVAQAALLGYAVSRSMVAGKEVGDHKKKARPKTRKPKQLDLLTGAAPKPKRTRKPK